MTNRKSSLRDHIKNPVVRRIIFEIGGAVALAELLQEPAEKRFVAETMLALGSDLIVSASGPSTVG